MVAGREYCVSRDASIATVVAVSASRSVPRTVTAFVFLTMVSFDN